MMGIRPFWAVLAAVVSAVGWWESQQLINGGAMEIYVYGGLVLILLLPTAMALCLVRRRRLGRWTSVCFLAQALALVLWGLLMPATIEDRRLAPVAWLLGQSNLTDGAASALLVAAELMFVLWVLLIPVTALFAWQLEPATPGQDGSGLRPWQALALAVVGWPVWLGIHAVVPYQDLADFARSPWGWLPAAAIVLAVTLLGRDRLGLVTSKGFVAQALLLQVWALSATAKLLPGTAFLLSSALYTVLEAAWVLVVIWLALVAWIPERRPVLAEA
ncbi:hypothetical protein [Kutzneria chonburiensis]|uniref:Uncharacterized protein n=1 Tax=Kutzneria chonburiensis TaxID=1483604 RepID=A0ABV6MS68_9PSEU|nr:hypothetical protein [Kutzneria chonburiensis]